MSDFQPAIPLAGLKANEITPVEVGDRQVAMYLVDGVPYCTEDLCTHDYCILSEGGYVEGAEVECACHGARFNVTSGAVTALPAVFPLRTFPVEVRDGHVYVDLS